MFDDDEFEMEKKNIASLAKFGAFPKKLKMGKRFEADEGTISQKIFWIS